MASNNRNLSGKCIARNFYRNYNCKTCVLSRTGRDRQRPAAVAVAAAVAASAAGQSQTALATWVRCPLCALTPSHLAYQCQTQTISVLSLGRIASHQLAGASCRCRGHNRCLHHPDLRPHNHCLLRVWGWGHY